MSLPTVQTCPCEGELDLEMSNIDQSAAPKCCHSNLRTAPANLGLFCHCYVLSITTSHRLLFIEEDTEQFWQQTTGYMVDGIEGSMKIMRFDQSINST